MKNTLKTKKLYLSNWPYNAARILTELESIVKNNGGKLCTTWEYGTPPAYMTERGEPCEIINRSLSGAIHEKRERLERLEMLKRHEAAAEVKKELEQLESITNEPKKMYYGEWLYISFTHNGYYYYYQLDENPFFEFFFSKRPIGDGNKINRNCYGKEDQKKWWSDDLWRWGRSDEEIKTAAQNIFNMLIAADISREYIDRKRKQFTNIYFLED